MPRPASVPDELRAGPFRGCDAVANGLVSRGQLRSGAWVRVLQGVYTHRELTLDGDVRIEALRLALGPGQVVCGRTAAWLHGVWTPRPDASVPLEVSTRLGAWGQGDGPARRRLVLRGGPDWEGGATGISVLDQDVVKLGGLPVLSPLRTCFDLIRERLLVESVVVADAFAWAGAIDLTTLAVYANDRRRWPRVREARVAISLAHAGARSPGESRLRMIPVLAGLPEPLVNVPLLDAGGRVLGVPDLTLIGPHGRRVGAEYDGGYHDVGEQPSADRRRGNRVVLGDLPLLRYDAQSLALERETVLAQLSAAIGVRPPNPLDERDFRRPQRSRAW